jgi:GNAT superfamily N-acetyltransferase
VPLPSLSLRPAVPADEAYLMNLYLELRLPEFSILPLTEPQLREIIFSQYRLQIAGYSSQHPGTGYAVILADGEPAGRIWVARDGGSIHIVDILIAARRRNQGIGTALIQTLQEDARQAGVPLRAWVNRANPGSLRFHQRNGFQIIREEQLDALLEWRG